MENLSAMQSGRGDVGWKQQAAALESAGGGTWVQSSHKPWSLWIQGLNPSVPPPAGMSPLTSLQV